MDTYKSKLKVIFSCNCFVNNTIKSVKICEPCENCNIFLLILFLFLVGSKQVIELL